VKLVEANNKKILLMGNPNVGKSVFFSKLTGVHTVSSNFAGTTVDYTEGKLILGDNYNKDGHQYTLIDVPGTYSLKPTSEAESVAVKLIQEGACAVICVLDATNLERNLVLALEMQACNIPIIYALNLSDVAKRRGILINPELLSKELNAPVVSTVAVKKQGLDELKREILKTMSSKDDYSENCASCQKCDSCPLNDSGRNMWNSAKQIAARVIKRETTALSKLDKLGEAMLKPWPGLPIAAFVLALVVGIVAFGGRALRFPLIALTDNAIIPFFRNIIERIFIAFSDTNAHLCYNYLYYNDGFRTGLRTLGEYSSYGDCTIACTLLNVLIGEYGIFVISFQWIIALILPYVFAFYVAITFLEDSGYLPRMSVLFDNIMRKLGVQGGSLIHVFLALGCAIPALLGSRSATTKKERLMVATIICFAVPCISQIGALIALLSVFSWWLLPVMVIFSLLLFISVAFVAGRLIKGRVDPLMLEIPNLLMPEPRAYFRKLLIRMKHFLKDAEFPMMLAILIAALLTGTGIIQHIAENVIVQSVVSGWLGMPEEAVISLILGVVRREMSVAPLLLLDLNNLQALVAGVVSLMYLPCLSVFGVVAKEFKIRFAIIVFVGTITLALFTGGLINQIARLFMAV